MESAENGFHRTKTFRYNSFRLSHTDFHHQFLMEVYILDIYRINLLRKNDVVLDLGAGIGDFSVLASKKVGPLGKVIAIEPDPDDYRLLENNIKSNYCSNIIPLNCGVGKESTERLMNFRGRQYTSKLIPLDTLLKSIGVVGTIDFVKMDIEGFETDVIGQSIGILKDCRIISIELHNTKNDVDGILSKHGFI